MCLLVIANVVFLGKMMNPSTPQGSVQAPSQAPADSSGNNVGNGGHNSRHDQQASESAEFREKLADLKRKKQMTANHGHHSKHHKTRGEEDSKTFLPPGREASHSQPHDAAAMRRDKNGFSNMEGPDKPRTQWSAAEVKRVRDADEGRYGHERAIEMDLERLKLEKYDEKYTAVKDQMHRRSDSDRGNEPHIAPEGSGHEHVALEQIKDSSIAGEGDEGTRSKPKRRHVDATQRSPDDPFVSDDAVFGQTYVVSVEQLFGWRVFH